MADRALQKKNNSFELSKRQGILFHQVFPISGHQREAWVRGGVREGDVCGVEKVAAEPAGGLTRSTRDFKFICSFEISLEQSIKIRVCMRGGDGGNPFIKR